MRISAQFVLEFSCRGIFRLPLCESHWTQAVVYDCLTSRRAGNFCHGKCPFPRSDDPVNAAGLVLDQFLDYLGRSADPGWVEREFQLESHDYWLRHVDAPNPPRVASLMRYC